MKSNPEPRKCRVGRWSLALVACLGAGVLQADPIPVTTTNDSGEGSLREAILAANASPGFDVIEFHIESAGTQTIYLNTPLPDIEEGLHLNGYTQGDAKENTLATGNDAVLRVVIVDSDLSVFQTLNILGGNCLIRGLVFNGAKGAAIRVSGHNNHIEGNYFGTDDGGSSVFSFTKCFQGIAVEAGATDCTIGGPLPGQRNLISGNTLGIGVDTSGPGTVIAGNYVGTDRTGLLARPNGVGIRIDTGSTQVGGDSAAERNIISGNAGDGVVLATNACSIRGNSIGVGADGSTKLRNEGDGIRVGAGASDNLILDNVIAYNHTGVGVAGHLAAGNRILGNRIHHNQPGLGIDLSDVVFLPPFASSSAGDVGQSTAPPRDGVTPNDDEARDVDIGGNRLQNFPNLEGVERVAGPGTRVQGELLSWPNEDYTIEVFGNSVADPSGHGEGEFFLGSFMVTTDGNGVAPIDQVVAENPGVCVSTTATRISTGDTSEFSACLSFTGNTYVVTNTDDSGAGSLRDAIEQSNASGVTDAVNRILFNIAGPAPHAILLSTPLDVLSAPVAILGGSQPTADESSPRIELESAEEFFAPALDISADNSSAEWLAFPGDFDAGVRAQNCAGVRVAHCNSGLDASGAPGDGNTAAFIFTNVTGGAIDRCRVGNCQQGILMGGGEDCAVTNSFIGAGPNGEDVGGHDNGLYCSSQKYCEVRGNRFGYARFDGCSLDFGCDSIEVVKNRYIANGARPIELWPIGQDVDDAGDFDNGPNGRQNHGSVSIAASAFGEVQVDGVFDGRPGRYLAEVIHRSDGPGVVENSLGFVSFETDENGHANFSGRFMNVPSMGSVVLTITSAGGNTSEMSLASPVVPLPKVTEYYSDFDGSTFAVSFTTEPGWSYCLRRSIYPSSGDWFVIGNPVAGTGGTVTIEDPFRPGIRAFYVVEMKPAAP